MMYKTGKNSCGESLFREDNVEDRRKEYFGLLLNGVKMRGIGVDVNSGIESQCR